MPKTFFVRKPSSLYEIEYYTQRRHTVFSDTPLEEYYVAEEIQLDENDFFDLQEDLLASRDWVEKFTNQDYPMKGKALPTIRVTCLHSAIVLIIDPQGYDYPRYIGLEIEEE